MFDLFTSDNKIIVFLRQLADMLLLNFIFLLCSIPIITIGASLSSLYYVMFQEAEEKAPKLWQQFWKAFKMNFKPSLRLWLPMLCIGLLLWVDIILAQSASGMLSIVVSTVVIVAEVFYCMVFSYLWPLLAKFENTTKDYFMKSLIFSVCHMPTTIVMCLVNVLPFVLAFTVQNCFTAVLLFMVFFGFALQALTNTLLVRRVFRPFLPTEEEPES